VSKVTRQHVYRIIASSLLLVPSNALVRNAIDRRIARIEARLSA
jgi:farnesyl-diphosphate farnesyltransferase